MPDGTNPHTCEHVWGTRSLDLPRMAVLLVRVLNEALDWTGAFAVYCFYLFGM
jgi:hypothetical protein